MKISSTLKGSLLLSAAIITLFVLQHPAKASAAATQIQVKICPSVVSSSLSVIPSSGSRTRYSRVVIAGSSKFGVTITISANGHAYSPLVVPAVNRFATTVPLRLGPNKLNITAANACGQSHSTAVAIYRTAPLPLSQIILGILCLIELLIIILLIVLLIICKRKRQKDEDKADRSKMGNIK